MKVVCYYRYSSANKAQVDNSELKQESVVEHMVNQKGWHIVKSVTDHAISGGKDKPNLIKLIEEVESGALKIDVLAIDELSRITRRQTTKVYKDLEWLEDNNILLSIADENNGEPWDTAELGDDIAKLVETWKNRKYVKDLSRHVKNGMTRRWNDGVLGWIGKAPYGYDLKKTVDNPTTLMANDDLPIIKQIFKLFLKNQNIRECVPLLEQTQYMKDNPDSSPNATTIKNILRSSIYAGIRTFGVRGVGESTISGHKKKWVAENPLKQCWDYQEYKHDGFKSIISLADYQKIQDTLDNNQKVFKQRPSRRKHKYSGRLRCGHCNGAMNAATYRHKKTGEVNISYVCPNSNTNRTTKCREDELPSRKSITTKEFETLLLRQFGLIFMDSSTHVKNISMLMDRIQQEGKAAADVADNDVVLQQGRLDSLTQLYAETGNDSLFKSIQKISANIEAIKDRKAEEPEHTVLQFAREQYRKAKGSEGRDRYLGMCYGAALSILKMEFDKREAAKIDCARRIRNLVTHGDGEFESYLANLGDDHVQTKAHSKLLDDRRAEIASAGWKMVGKSATAGRQTSGLGPNKETQIEQCWQILQDMNLNHIRVFFDLGLRRGKPSRIPTELNFAFSVAASNYTSNYVVSTRNQIEALFT